MVAELGEVVWIVDLNRQSLDRVVPDIGAPRLQGMFAAAGWQVLTVKYGRLLTSCSPGPAAARCATASTTMTNPEYQRLLRLPARPAPRPAARRRAGRAARSGSCSPTSATSSCTPPSATWAGTTCAALAHAFGAIDDTRPTVIFAYTVKGYGLAIEGHPQNHSALLTAASCAELAAPVRRRPGRALAAVRPNGSAEDELCAATAARLRREPPAPRAEPRPAGRPRAVPRAGWPPRRPRWAGRCST